MVDGPLGMWLAAYWGGGLGSRVGVSLPPPSLRKARSSFFIFLHLWAGKAPREACRAGAACSGWGGKCSPRGPGVWVSGRGRRRLVIVVASELERMLVTWYVSVFANVYDIRTKEQGTLQQNQPAHDSLFVLRI